MTLSTTKKGQKVMHL